MNHFFCKNVSNPVINVLNSKLIEYNHKIYQNVANVISSANDRVVFSFHNQPFLLLRRNQPYLYEDTTGNKDFLVFDNSVYILKKEYKNDTLKP
jgi:hypothetical protein